MANVRRSIFWATRSLGVLVISLFSVMHLTPPAWAKAVGDKDRQTINDVELTSLIADLGQNVWFDDRLEDELQRLRGTAATSQNLAQTAPQPNDSIELLTPEQLAPPANVLMPQAPNADSLPDGGGADLMRQAPNADSIGVGEGADLMPQQAYTFTGRGGATFCRPPVSRYSGSRQSSHSRFRRPSHSKPCAAEMFAPCPPRKV